MTLQPSPLSLLPPLSVHRYVSSLTSLASSTLPGIRGFRAVSHPLPTWTCRSTLRGASFILRGFAALRTTRRTTAAMSRRGEDVMEATFSIVYGYNGQRIRPEPDLPLALLD